MRLELKQDGAEREMATILVVDDDMGCRRLTSKVLAIHGYSTVVAANGIEALQALDRENVDLILLDLMMPEMDGLSFINVMRQHSEWANVPVLVLSGIADLEVANKVKESGVQGYLVKSRYSIDELLRRVRQQLAGDITTKDPHPN
jgi:two-component system response regulator MprA